jgi:hypothetical protein
VVSITLTTNRYGYTVDGNTHEGVDNILAVPGILKITAG